MSAPIVIRPKSMATVVPVFPSTGPASSTPTLSTVIAASVVSGSISEIEPTNVVLPTAKPPATTIFIDTGAPPPVTKVESEGANAIKQPFEKGHVGMGVGRTGG